MKNTMRYVLVALAVLLLGIVLMAGYVSMLLPNVGPAPEISVEITDERVAHGAYLANHVMLCMDCHAVRDFSLYSGPPKPETLGAGGEVFDQSIGLPGTFISRNLTPHAMDSWTDGELFRAITSGVSKDGKALFPIMPYPNYSQLDEEDIYAVIAYIRSLEPVENVLPESRPDFPVSLLINTMPVKPTLQPKPDRYDVVDYGRYITTAASCTDCHTRMERGAFVGEPFAGGNAYILPGNMMVHSSNITPHHETGIGSWTKEQFINRFKVYADTSYVPHQVQPGQFQTIMPWLMYAHMDEEDLGAIYEYLQTLEPVENRVEIFTQAR